MKEYIFPTCSNCRIMRIAIGAAAIIVIGVYIALLYLMGGNSGKSEY